MKSFQEGVRLLERSHRVLEGWVGHSEPRVVDEVTRRLAEGGVTVAPLTVEPEEYRLFAERAGYDRRYPEYARGFRAEKAFEHLVALRLLGLEAGEVFVDVASDTSPLHEIAGRLAGCRSYRQDVMYRPGLSRDRIGGDASRMPVPDGFAAKAALTCSLEHFEGDADRRLFVELGRVLRPGGRVCVVPFYAFTELVNQTDPTFSVGNDVPFDDGVVLYCAEGWKNRFGRFYSPEAFVERVVQPTRGVLEFEAFRLLGAPEIDPSIYARLALVATRR